MEVPVWGSVRSCGVCCMAARHVAVIAQKRRCQDPEIADHQPAQKVRANFLSRCTRVLDKIQPDSVSCERTAGVQAPPPAAGACGSGFSQRKTRANIPDSEPRVFTRGKPRGA